MSRGRIPLTIHQIQRSHSGALGRIVRQVFEVSVFHITIVGRLLRLRLTLGRWLRWFLSRVLYHVTQGPDNHTVDEPEHESVCQKPQQSADHGYFLLTGL